MPALAFLEPTLQPSHMQWHTCEETVVENFSYTQPLLIERENNLRAFILTSSVFAEKKKVQ